MLRPRRLVMPHAALPNYEAMSRWGVRAAFSAIDGMLRQVYPVVDYATTVLGSPATTVARAGGLAVAHDSASMTRFTGLHNYVDCSSNAIPLAIFARYDRIGPSTEFDNWGGILGIVHSTTNLCMYQRQSNSTQLNVYTALSIGASVSGYLDAERTDVRVVAQSYGSAGRSFEFWENGELLGSGTAGINRPAGSTDLRLVVNSEVQQNASYSGAATLRDVFIFNRQLFEDDIKTLSSPNAEWDLYDLGRRTYFIPAAAPPGGFIAAWARNRSAVIGAGMH